MQHMPKELFLYALIIIQIQKVDYIIKNKFTKQLLGKLWLSQNSPMLDRMFI